MSKKKEQPKTKTTKETRILKCFLTQEEILQAGDDLATALDNLKQVQAEKDSVSRLKRQSWRQTSQQSKCWYAINTTTGQSIATTFSTMRQRSASSFALTLTKKLSEGQ